MEPLTREQWDIEWWACQDRLTAQGRDSASAWKLAREITTARYGPQPEGASLGLKVWSSVTRRKLLGVRVTGGVMKQRIIVSVCFGLAGALAAVQVNGLPSTREGWLGLGGVFVAAAWGKFSSNTTWVAPDRATWTPEKRAEIVNGGK